MTALQDQHTNFTIFLPSELIDLPAGEQDIDTLRSLAAAIAGRFGLEADLGDQGLAETTAMLAATGAAAAAAGALYTAAGVFQSPDVPRRPLMVLVTCFLRPSNYANGDEAIAELKSQQGSRLANIVHLPAGKALVVEEASASTTAIGDDPITITTHQLTAWVPTADQIAVVAVSSNNTADWPHIADFAHGLFETFEWTADDDA